MQSPTPLTQDSVQKQNLYRVIYVALCGTVLFTAYCSIQSLISELYIQLGFGSLGRLCMLVYFGIFAFCSIVAPYYTKKMNAKTGLIFGTCCYTTFVLAGVLTTFCTKYEMSGGMCSSNFLYSFNLLAAAGVGVGASIYWLCQSTYVNSCADESTKGLFNGTFWSIFQLCQITSSTLATVILSTYDQFTFFSFLLIFCIASIVMLTFMKDPIQDQDIIHVASNNDTEGGSIAETFYDFYMMMQERKYHGLCFGVFFSGLAIGCYIAFIGSAVALTVEGADMNELNKSIGMVLMVLAIGEISAGLSAGKVADMYNKFKVFTATMYMNEAALVCTFLSCLFGSYKLALICAFLWGYGDTSIQTMIGTLIGFAYGGKPILFSAYRVFQNFGIMSAILICILIPKSMPLLYVVLMGTFMTISHYYYRINTPENGVEKKGSLLAKSEKTLIELEEL